MRSYNAKSRIHVFEEGETLMENMRNRRNRPVKMYREVVLRANKGLEGLIRWSQTAGCACGCSPGFIVERTLYGDHGKPVDIYLTINADPEVEAEDYSYVELAQS